jgi:transposase-like protein
MSQFWVSLFSASRKHLLVPALDQQIRTFAVGKRGRPTIRATVIKDKESIERRRQHARDAKARNATDMDRHVLQAYKVKTFTFNRFKFVIAADYPDSLKKM